MNRELWENRTFTNENPINYPCPKCSLGFLALKRKIVMEITPSGTEMESYSYPNGIEHIFNGTLICKNEDCKELVSISGRCLKDIRTGKELPNGEMVEHRFSTYYPKFFFPNLGIIALPKEVSENVIEQINLSFSHYFNDFTLRNKITKYRYSEGIKDYLNSYALTKEVADLNTFNKVAFAGLSFEKTNEMMEPQFLKVYRAKKGVGIKEKVQEVSSAMFGKEQTFNLKTSNYEIDESLYIPELITINNVGSFDESINRYRVNKHNLSIEYNTDIKNKNGVALLILWDGTTQDMSIQELGSMNMEYKNKIVVFNPIDSGILNVPQSALSKFPKNANITILLMRGNAKIIEKGNKKHYLVTSSEQYEHIVLED